MIKSYIKDFIQNYKDAPNLWTTLSNTATGPNNMACYYNDDHRLHLAIKEGKVVTLEIGNQTNLVSLLSPFDKSYLRHHMVIEDTPEPIIVPTKTNSPEAFI